MFASVHTAALATRTALPRRAGRVGRSLTRAMGQWMADALAARRQRRALAALDAHSLRDLGLTRDQALAEAARPVWDVPPHWRH